MNKQRNVLITITYNEMGIITDTKAEEVTQPETNCSEFPNNSDTISRQAAIDAVEKNACNTQRIMDAVNNLPSAQPEPKEGEWEQVSAQRYFMSASYFYRCSACGINNVRNTNFCPNCGADMRGERQK